MDLSKRTPFILVSLAFITLSLTGVLFFQSSQIDEQRTLTTLQKSTHQSWLVQDTLLTLNEINLEQTPSPELTRTLNRQTYLLRQLQNNETQTSPFTQRLSELTEFVELVEQTSKTPKPFIEQTLMQGSLLVSQLQKQQYQLEVELQAAQQQTYHHQIIFYICSLLFMVISGFYLLSRPHKKVPHELSALLSEHDLYQKMLDNAHEGVHLVNDQGILIEANQPFCQLLGYQKEEIMGQPYSLWDMSPEFAPPMSQHFPSLEPVKMTRKFMHKNGHVIYCDLNILPLKLNNEIVFYASAYNITTQRQLKKKVNFLQTQSQALYWRLDMDTHLVEISNPKLFGRTESLIDYQAWLDFIHPDERSNFAKQIFQLSQNIITQISLSLRVHFGNQDYHWFAFNADITERDADGLATEITAFLLDLQAQKQAEEDEKQALQNTQSALQAKSDFLSSISHEIRIPLNSIIGLSDILLQKPNCDAREDYLHRIKHSSISLLHVVNDIIDFSKIESHRLTFIHETFDLDQLLLSVIESFEHLAQQKRLAINLYIDPALPISYKGDAQRITQVLNNLVSNAIQYSDKGEISIAVAMESRQGQQIQLQFSIIDTGEGVNINALNQYFTAQTSAPPKPKDPHHKGLGLVISHKLITLMGGHIWVEANVPQGSKFHFNLSLNYIGRLELDDISMMDEQGACYLIFSQNKTSTDYLRRLLEHWHLDYSVVSHPEEALMLLREESFHSILIDHQASQGSLQFMAKVQQQFPSVNQVLLIDKHYKKSLVNKNQRYHIEPLNLLTKPLTPATIYEKLFNTELNRHRLENDAYRQLYLLSTKSALLVEDNSANQIVASAMLSDIGFDVQIAQNGQEAVTLCQSQRFDLILMDIQMPIMDGLEATRQIRTFDHITPIIALSAAVMEQDKQQSQRAGMQHHLAKPIEKQQLNFLIAEYFDTESVYLNHQPDPEDLIKLEHVDVGALFHELGHNRKTAYDLLLNFARSLTTTIETLKQIPTESNLFFNHIHRVKGTSGNLKINTLYEQTVKIELFRHEPNKLNQALREFYHLSQTIIHEIEYKLQPNSPALVQHDDAIAALLDKLAQHRLIKSPDIEPILQQYADHPITHTLPELLATNQHKELKAALLELQNQS